MAVVLMGDSSLGVAPQHLYNCFVCVEHNPSLPHKKFPVLSHLPVAPNQLEILLQTQLCSGSLISF